MYSLVKQINTYRIVLWGCHVSITVYSLLNSGKSVRKILEIRDFVIFEENQISLMIVEDFPDVTGLKKHLNSSLPKVLMCSINDLVGRWLAWFLAYYS